MPERTRSPITGGVSRFALPGGRAVDAMTLISAISTDHRVVVGLRMRPAAKGTAHALGVALRMMVNPSTTPSAEDRAGVRLSAYDAAVDAGDDDKLAEILTSNSARRSVLEVDPRDT